MSVRQSKTKRAAFAIQATLFALFLCCISFRDSAAFCTVQYSPVATPSRHLLTMLSPPVPNPAVRTSFPMNEIRMSGGSKMRVFNGCDAGLGKNNNKSRDNTASIRSPSALLLPSSWSPFLSRKHLTAASAALLTTAVLTSFPSWSHALDLAFVSGGASSLASSTNSFLSSLSETGFYQAFSLVFVSEIGDKTFFIAGLLAMKTSKLISFLGSMAALFVMTLISVLIGQAFHAVPTGFLGGDGVGIPLDDVAAVLAFAFFGYKTLKEALEMEEGTSTMDEELAEAEEEVEASDTTKQNTAIARILSIFGLVFAAEFGDRSFLSTIALSAAQNPASVAAGAVAAHAVATGIAVSGGAVVAKYLSEKVIGIIGGSLFIVFAITTALGIF
ncbi:UPF0016 domain containing protein [Nitzschia inconspicua]|uniref:GDT1 family protein n=1 Tax=Nitzschia inconspicua TaxID=303405 RepID=A0A9K3LTX2_9STRA|nr:UPF0016 domain containing protein [Nitzschia inconspicua]